MSVILSTLESPTRSLRPSGTSLVSGVTFPPSLHRQLPLAAALLFPHSPSPCLSSPSTYEVLTACTFRTCSEPVQNQCRQR